MQAYIDKDQAIQQSLFRFCFYVTVLSNLVIYIEMPFHINVLEAFASRCFMFSNLLAFLYTVNLSSRKYMPYITNQIVMIVLMILFSMISYLISDYGEIYPYIIHMWSYLALAFYLLYMEFITPDRNLVLFVFVVNLMISLVFILLSFSSLSYRGYELYIGTNRAWLTLGYSNPNQTAMYLMLNYFVLFCMFFYYKGKCIKILMIPIMLMIGTLLYKTTSRTCILLTVLFTLFLLIKRKPQLSKFIPALFLLLPVLFSMIYPVLYRKGFLSHAYLGKNDYSSRVALYTSAMKTLGNQWLFGNYNAVQLQNYHNGPISIVTSLGIFGLIIYYVYMFRAYYHLRLKHLKSKTSLAAYVGLLFLFAHACTESAFLTAGSMYAGSASILILLVKLDGKEVSRNKNNLLFKLSNPSSTSLL